MNAMTPIDEPLDILIVGAGISGIGMAAHLRQDCPGKRFAIIERRERLGGTWDLFRYPGIRSDSDMYTLGFAFEPWRDERSIAEGGLILDYLDRVVDRHGLREHIRFGQHVLSADWDSKAGLWTLAMADGTRLQARFLFIGAGYYDHDTPHDAQIPGLADFGGATVHPQFWQEDLDYTGKRVVVIGSGATAVTLVPAMAEKAAHVTMLQRTPTWMVSRPSRDGLANLLRRFLPARWTSGLMRRLNARMQSWLYNRCKTAPTETAAWFTGQLRQQLGDAYDPEAFSPPYNPWDQRLCVVPDGDFFDAVKSGKASIVTGTIDHVDKSGVTLGDGSHLEADIIVPATGLRLALMGKIAISLDGKPVNFADHFYYRSCMFSNVPNFAALFGYLNAGWTLRVDSVADWLCRLFNHMDAWGREVVTPCLPQDHGLVVSDPIAAYSSGYLQRSRALMPKSAASGPWRISMDYIADRKEMRDAPINDGVLRFERAGSHIPLATALP